MYVIDAFVAKTSILTEHFPVSDRYIVALGYENYSLIPIVDEISDSTFKSVKDNPDTQSVLDAIKKCVTCWENLTFAYISAEIFGGDGGQSAYVFDKGQTYVFKNHDTTWPNSNISQALKLIGVSEQLDQKKDAFDILDLGRFRDTQDWLESS